MTTPQQFDLIVIGGGPAGEKGAAQAAFFGKKVALVERLPWLRSESTTPPTSREIAKARRIAK